MHLQRHPSVDAFYTAAEPLLLRNEAANCLPIGLCATLRQDVTAYGQEPPYFATVDDGGAVVAAALMTPPYRPVLSLSERPEALELIVQDLLAGYEKLPGVNGPKPLAERFAARWQELTGQPHHLTMAQRIYQIERVEPVRPVPGFFRQITPADRDTISEWLHAFHAEADPPAGPTARSGDWYRAVDQALAGNVRRFFVWDDGGPVTFAGCAGPTPNGIRIGPVYTPPEKRKRGYASACVAALSQLMLDEGRRFAFLFTDLANPTSNHIYQAIGYRPVVDVDMYGFGEG